MRRLLIILMLAAGTVCAQSNTSDGAQTTSLGAKAAKTVVMKTGTLASTTTTANQTVLTYTVTAGKTFYLQYFETFARLTTYAATATNFGTCSLTIGGTTMHTAMMANAGDTHAFGHDLPEPVPVAAGTAVALVCTPSAATAFTWQANLGGFER